MIYENHSDFSKSEISGSLFFSKNDIYKDLLQDL